MFDGPDHNKQMNDAQDAFTSNPCMDTADEWLGLAYNLVRKRLITIEDFDFVYATVEYVYSVSTCQT